MAAAASLILAKCKTKRGGGEKANSRADMKGSQKIGQQNINFMKIKHTKITQLAAWIAREDRDPDWDWDWDWEQS